MRSRGVAGGLRGLVALVCLAASCSTARPSRTTSALPAAPVPGSASTPVGRAHPSHLVMPHGAIVDVPAGAVAGPGTLTGSPAPNPGSAPGGFAVAGGVYRLGVAGTQLTSPVTVTLPLPAEAAGGDATLAYWSPPASSWLPVASRVDARAGTVSAATPHLSIWTVMVSYLGRSALNYLTSTADVAQPSCPGEADLRTGGATVVSSPGNLVKWCAGTTGGHDVLRIANNRTFALEVAYPSEWPAQRTSGDPLTERISDSLARLLALPPVPGQSTIVVGGGRSIELTLPAGSTGRVSVEVSGPAEEVAAFGFALDTLAIVTHVPLSDDDTTARLIEAAFASKDCVANFEVLTALDPSTAGGLAELFSTTARYAVGCLGPLWETAYGHKGALAQQDAATLLWVQDALGIALKTGRAAFDIAATYRILLRSPQSPPPTSCPDVVLQYDTENGASQVSVAGTDCVTAVAIIHAVDAADKRQPPGLSGTPLALTADGFACQAGPGALQGGTYTYDLRCVAGGRQVAFRYGE